MPWTQSYTTFCTLGVLWVVLFLSTQWEPHPVVFSAILNSADQGPHGITSQQPHTLTQLRPCSAGG